MLIRTLSLAFSREYIFVNIFFHIYFFVSEKTKAAIGDVLRKEMFRKFHRKTLLLQSLFDKVSIKKRFQHRCFSVKFAKEDLRTTTSKKINICLIVNVFLLRKIKLLNKNVNNNTSILTYLLCRFKALGKVIIKTTEESQASHRRLQTSLKRVQTSTDKSRTIRGESHTTKDKCS